MPEAVDATAEVEAEIVAATAADAAVAAADEAAGKHPQFSPVPSE
jgi:hypothetical protein